MSEGRKEAERADDEVVAKAEVEVEALPKQMHELQRVPGKNTLENEILREAMKIAHKKLRGSRARATASPKRRRARGTASLGR